MAEKNIARLVKIIRYENSASEGTELDSAELVRDFGIAGDIYAGRGERQVSILSRAARSFIDSNKSAGLCFARFKENLLYDGDFPDTIAEGTQIFIGGAVVTAVRAKSCFLECGLFGEGRLCLLALHGRFARVTKGGIIRAGDKIQITEFCD